MWKLLQSCFPHFCRECLLQIKMAELDCQRGSPVSREQEKKQLMLIQEKEELLKELRNAQRHIRRKEDVMSLQEKIDTVEKEIGLAKDELRKSNTQRWGTII